MISIPILILTFMPSAPQSGSIAGITGHKLSRSIVTRDMIWDGCLKMIKLKPLTGWGLLGVWEQGSRFIMYDGKVIHSHNIWISFLTFLGPIGLSIYLYMKLYLFKSIKILYSQNSRIAALMAGIQALVIGHGLVDVAFMAPQTGILFFANSALICSLVVQYSTLGKPIPLVSYKSLSKTG
jgi:O-antigen ligase